MNSTGPKCSRGRVINLVNAKTIGFEAEQPRSEQETGKTYLEPEETYGLNLTEEEIERCNSVLDALADAKMDLGGALDEYNATLDDARDELQEYIDEFNGHLEDLRELLEAAEEGQTAGELFDIEVEFPEELDLDFPDWESAVDSLESIDEL
jgi:hypothetical protein